jgi:hypothetical protein
MLSKFHEAIGIFIKTILCTNLIVCLPLHSPPHQSDSDAPPSPFLQSLQVMAKGGSDALIFCLSSCDDFGKLHKFNKLATACAI